MHYQRGLWRAYATGEDPTRFESLSMVLREPGQTAATVCVQLSPEAEPMRSDQLTPERVATQLPPFQIPRYWPETWKQRARQNPGYEGNGYFVGFCDGQLAELSLGLRETDPVNPVTRPVARPPRVGPAGCSPLYTLPLTREQLDDILGAGGEVNRHGEVYY